MADPIRDLLAAALGPPNEDPAALLPPCERWRVRVTTAHDGYATVETEYFVNQHDAEAHAAATGGVAIPPNLPSNASTAPNS